MKGIKQLMTGVVIGVVLGLWMGVNIGKGQPVWGNPFADKPLSERAKETADRAIKNAKDALRKKLDEE
jgi:hypothetical protein